MVILGKREMGALLLPSIPAKHQARWGLAERNTEHRLGATCAVGDEGKARRCER